MCRRSAGAYVFLASLLTVRGARTSPRNPTILRCATTTHPTTNLALCATNGANERAIAASTTSTSSSTTRAAAPTPSDEWELGLVLDENAPTTDRVKAALKSPFFELLGGYLVIISSTFYALSTVPNLSPDDLTALGQGEDFVGIFFAIEYMVRWYARSFRPGFILEPISVIDLLSFAPVLLRFLMPGMAGDGSGFAFLRLLRILRLQRYVADYASFRKFELALGIRASDVRPYQLEVARVASSIFTLVFVATGLIYEAEHTTNPGIPDFFTALYFGLTTLTTVGFGDITPITAEGRLVVCASILVGIAVIPLQLSSLAESLFMQEGLLAPEFERKPPRAASGGGDPAAPRSPAAVRCRACGAEGHVSLASFCFRCGASLSDVEVRD